MYSVSPSKRNRPLIPPRSVRPSESTWSLKSRPQTPQLLRRPASSASIRSPTPLSIRRPTTPSLNNNSIMYTGKIKVSVRIKPNHNNNSNSSSNDLPADWYVDSLRHIISGKELGGELSFDNIYQDDVSNVVIYDHSVRDIVDKVMNGYNGTVFAYGMTGTGKTFSMQGTHLNPGIVPLSVESIFNHVYNNADDQQSFVVSVGYLEIYNEHLYDLLNPATPSDEIKLRDDVKLGVKAMGLKEVVVNSPMELLDCITQGDSIRRTEGTDFNTRSSRSHAVLQITIESKNAIQSTQNFVSTLYLCDLAGSERAVSQTERRKEGSYINKSLLTLGTIIARLSSSGSSLAHIPYRDSKLTRLLQPALSGRSLVSVLCTIQILPSIGYVETISTLRFAARAKNITVSVKRNDELLSGDSNAVQKLLQQVAQQKLEIQQLRSSIYSSSTSSASSTSSTSSFTSVSSTSSSLFSSTSTSTNQVAQLEAENKILHERVEHLTRLCDDSRLDEVIGLSLADNDDDDDDDGNSSSMVAPKQQIEEYKSYISHLEKQLYQHELSNRSSVLSNSSTCSSPTTVSTPLSTTTKDDYSASSSKQYYIQVIKDLKEQVDELRESNRDKDRIINALKSVNKQRETISNHHNNTAAYSRYYFSGGSSNSLPEKHNNEDNDDTITSFNNAHVEINT